MGKLDTDHGPYVELMSPGRVYVVPDYQRQYSWKAKTQVAELWGDILRLYVNAVDEDKFDPHFIGSVVIGTASSKALGPVECPVIDGQQRLITLALIVAAIRDQLVDDPDDQAEITAQYLAHYKKNMISAVRVRPGATDRAAFDAIIRQEDSFDAKGLIGKAYNYVVDRLVQGPTDDQDPDEGSDKTEYHDAEESAERLEEDDPDDLQDAEETVDDGTVVDWDWSQLLSVVGTQLELVSIADVPPESAYQIFASLNSKGLPLSQVDLVRNAVFMLMPSGGAKAHRDYWLPMESVMGKPLLQSYLHTWVIRKGHNVPAKEIYASAVKEFSRPGYKEADVKRQLKELQTGAWSYMLVTHPGTADRAKFGTGPRVSKAMVQAFVRLRLWGSVPMEPVLVEIVERFRTSQLTAQQVLSLLAYLESFVVRRFILQTPPNDLRSTFARLTQQIRRKTTANAFEQALLDGLQEKARRWPTDSELREAFLRRPLYRAKGQRQSFFVLRRIAEKLEGKESPQIVQGTTALDYSIEHVLPQSFPEHWRKDLAAWKDPNPRETWELYVHTAGNLTLTAYNSELSTLRFVNPSAKMDKKRWIKNHLKLELSKTIVTENKWTRKEIEARSLALAEEAKGIWPLP